MIFLGIKWLYLCKSGVNRKRGCIRAKQLEFGQSGFLLAKMVVIGQKLLYSGKCGFIRAKWLYSGKRWLYSGKVVFFVQK